MSRRRAVYLVITPGKVHAFGSGKRRDAVLARFTRMFKLPKALWCDCGAFAGGLKNLPEMPIVDYIWPATWEFNSVEIH